MNFDKAELAYEDGARAARRRGIFGSGRVTVLRQLRVFCRRQPTGAGRRTEVARP
jgi:hypothetical protein